MWREELSDLMHGVGGALLFGVPLLYTMEVWWLGSHVAPWHMLAGLLLTYITLIALNRATGFRRHSDQSFARSLTDSIEALAIGLLVAAGSLWLLRRINVSIGIEPMLGHIVLEGIPFGLGVGIANGIFRSNDDADQADSAQVDQAPSDESQESQSIWKSTLADAGSTALGAIIVAFSIAPTDEVPMIASALTPWLLLLIVAVSLIVSYVIVFVADFGSREDRKQDRGLFQSPITETVVSYIIALIMAAIMLVLFKQVDFSSPLHQWVDYIVTLGLPATVGGAAGRLAV